MGRGQMGPTFCPLLPRRFLCDDVDFNLRVHSAGLLLCRFNRFSVMKKQIAVGGHRSFHITSKVRAPAESAAGAVWAADWERAEPGLRGGPGSVQPCSPARCAFGSKASLRQEPLE